MIIAVEGCAHGALDQIYDTIKYTEQKNNIKVDVLICCGDFQSTRNSQDLRCMAIPEKYYDMCSFYKYYSGEKEAPILTIFIGGNHEASNYLQELPYGGWVAPKIYYLGYAGCINIAGVRIAGISGIYKGKDYFRGRYEYPPYDGNTKRSVYHVRNLDVFRLKQLSQPINIFISHDWPEGVAKFGNVEKLLKTKPFFKTDIESDRLGSKPSSKLLTTLKPQYWFAAHLHTRFAAIIPHENKEMTKFLALDKCLPKRKFLQIFDIPHNNEEKIELNYDLEWLTILHLTNHLLNVKPSSNYMPGPGCDERWQFQPTEEEKSHVLKLMGGNLVIPNNFTKTAPPHDGGPIKRNMYQPQPQANPQTQILCKKLEIDDPIQLILNWTKGEEEEQNTNNADKNEQTPPINKRINLPEPKGDTSDFLTPNEGFNEELNTDKKAFNDETINESANSETILINKDTTTPLVKKFKRRNADMYKNEEG